MIHVGPFMEMECMSFEVPTRFLLASSLGIMQYSGMNMDIGRPLGYGKFELIKENDLVKARLLEGKGVFHEGAVYFYKPTMEKSRHYLNFKQLYDIGQATIELNCQVKSEQYMAEQAVDMHQVPIMKSIINLYYSRIINRDRAIGKLKAYLPDASVDELLLLTEAEHRIA